MLTKPAGLLPARAGLLIYATLAPRVRRGVRWGGKSHGPCFCPPLLLTVPQRDLSGGRTRRSAPTGEQKNRQRLVGADLCVGPCPAREGQRQRLRSRLRLCRLTLDSRSRLRRATDVASPLRGDAAYPLRVKAERKVSGTSPGLDDPKGSAFPSLITAREGQPSPAGGRRSALAQTDPPNIFSLPPGAAHSLFDVSKREWGAHPPWKRSPAGAGLGASSVLPLALVGLPPCRERRVLRGEGGGDMSANPGCVIPLFAEWDVDGPFRCCSQI